MEVELAKCKIDMMSLNSQLLDAIQQKVNLSQQLEAWQVSSPHCRRAGSEGIQSTQQRNPPGCACGGCLPGSLGIEIWRCSTSVPVAMQKVGGGEVVVIGFCQGRRCGTMERLK